MLGPWERPVRGRGNGRIKIHPHKTHTVLHEENGEESKKKPNTKTDIHKKKQHIKI